MPRVYWNFRLRIESKKVLLTKEMIEELNRLFESSEKISHYEIIEAMQIPEASK